jgi:ketopantoate hydroxymethyltransferase
VHGVSPDARSESSLTRIHRVVRHRVSPAAHVGLMPLMVMAQWRVQPRKPRKEKRLRRAQGPDPLD